MRFLAIVARSAIKVWKLCTGKSSSVRKVRALSCALAEGLAGTTGESRCASAVALSSSSKSKGLAHMPLDVIGEHAEKDMGTDPIDQVMIDGADLEVDGLVAAKRLLDVAEVFVGTHRLLGVERCLLYIRADDVDPIEGGLLGDFHLITRIGEACLADVETKVFRHLEAMEHLPDA